MPGVSRGRCGRDLDDLGFDEDGMQTLGALFYRLRGGGYEITAFFIPFLRINRVWLYLN
jgi:hypothetical protein